MYRFATSISCLSASRLALRCTRSLAFRCVRTNVGQFTWLVPRVRISQCSVTISAHLIPFKVSVASSIRLINLWSVDLSVNCNPPFHDVRRYGRNCIYGLFSCSLNPLSTFHAPKNVLLICLSSFLYVSTCALLVSHKGSDAYSASVSRLSDFC